MNATPESEEPDAEPEDEEPKIESELDLKSNKAKYTLEDLHKKVEELRRKNREDQRKSEERASAFWQRIGDEIVRQYNLIRK